MGGVNRDYARLMLPPGTKGSNVNSAVAALNAAQRPMRSRSSHSEGPGRVAPESPSGRSRGKLTGSGHCRLGIRAPGSSASVPVTDSSHPIVGFGPRQSCNLPLPFNPRFTHRRSHYRGSVTFANRAPCGVAAAIACRVHSTVQRRATSEIKYQMDVLWLKGVELWIHFVR